MHSDKPLRDDRDTPWKKQLHHHFEQFLDFFWPDAHADVDWSRECTALDAELQKISIHDQTGRRFADKLMRVHRKNGDEKWVFVHIEIQGQADPHFARRMHEYRQKISLHYGHTPESIAVLADPNPDFRPDRYETRGPWHSRDVSEFYMVKLLDYRPRIEALVLDRNIFAFLVAAHLRSMESRGNPGRRWAFKVELMRLHYKAGFTRDEVRERFEVAEFLLPLPRPFEDDFLKAIFFIEQEQNVAWITQMEEMAIHRGKAEGKLEGKAEGRTEEAVELVLRQLTRRCGSLAESQSSRVRALPLAKVEALAEDLLDFADINDLERWLALRE